MAFFLPALVGLAGGWVADQHLNDGRATSAVTGTVGGAFEKSMSRNDENDGASGTKDNDPNNPLSLLGNNWGKLLGLGGIMASPLPTKLKMLGAVALLVYAIFDHFKNSNKSEFNSASVGEREQRNVLERTLPDPNDPHIAVQSARNDDGEIDPSLEAEPT